MLFDMEDYRSMGMIGRNQTPMTPQKWQDVATIAQATRDALFKSVGEWYSQSNMCDEGTCRVTPSSLYAEYVVKRDNFIIVQNSMLTKLVDGELTKSEYDNYTASLKSVMSTVKRLCIVVDGDSLAKI